MKINIADSYQNMSKAAAESFFDLLQSIEKLLICVASGASPAGLYKELVQVIRAGAIDTSNWYFVSLDEWSGLNGSDEGSSRYQLNEQLFQPLNIKEAQICFFDGRATNTNDECEKVEAFIKAHGCIDIAILGIGINGHIAMNEPGTSAALRSHVASIHLSTQQIAQKYFKEYKKLDSGLTLGLATLQEAKYLLLLAAGKTKAESIYKMLHEPVNEIFPATLIRAHKSLHIHLDAEAASLLQ